MYIYITDAHVIKSKEFFKNMQTKRDHNLMYIFLIVFASIEFIKNLEILYAFCLLHIECACSSLLKCR